VVGMAVSGREDTRSDYARRSAGQVVRTAVHGRDPDRGAGYANAPGAAAERRLARAGV